MVDTYADAGLSSCLFASWVMLVLIRVADHFITFYHLHLSFAFYHLHLSFITFYHFYHFITFYTVNRRSFHDKSHLSFLFVLLFRLLFWSLIFFAIVPDLAWFPISADRTPFVCKDGNEAQIALSSGLIPFMMVLGCRNFLPFAGILKLPPLSPLSACFLYLAPMVYDLFIVGVVSGLTDSWLSTTFSGIFGAMQLEFFLDPMISSRLGIVGALNDFLRLKFFLSSSMFLGTTFTSCNVSSTSSVLFLLLSSSVVRSIVCSFLPFSSLLLLSFFLNSMFHIDERRLVFSCTSRLGDGDRNGVMFDAYDWLSDMRFLVLALTIS